MNIKIRNYKNLKSIDYSIDDNKTNFLFGLSGSGKSSVLNALCDDSIGDNKTFGSSDSDNQVIEIDGVHVSPKEMHVFDVNKVNFILKDNSIEPIREVIIEDPTEHEKNHRKLESRLSKLNEALIKEQNKYNDIEKFLSEMKIKKLNKGNTIPASSVISKAITNIKTISSKKIFSSISSYDGKYLDWLMRGIEYIKDEKCPFCEKKMPLKRKSKLNKIKNLDTQNILNLKKELSIHASLFDGVIAFQYSEIKSIEKKIISFAKAVDVYKKINEQVNSMFELNYDCTKFVQISFDSDFATHFPESCREYKKLCNNIPKLIASINKTHVDTDTFLKNKKGIINSLLEKADIPYKFDVKYHRSGPNEYFITHNKNSKNSDNRNCLSEGEKSIVSLILFLVSSSKTNYKLYMIDDPVSSFDNLRRKYIFNLIKEYMKGKTVIVLSHDAVFAKFAIKDSEKNFVGQISYLSNNGNGNANVISIKNLQLWKFNKCVIERLKKATGEYQKAVLVRLIIEDEYGNHSPKYGYLSKILHGESYANIMNWFSRKGITENDLLKDINIFLEKNGLSSNFLAPLSATYNVIDTTNFTDYEKCILLRELMDKEIVTSNSSIKEELNNYIHLADTLDIMINPFEFPMISRNLSDYFKTISGNYTI